MKILLTEASSQVAYHLLPMLAAGDVIYDQKIELILSDCVDASRDIEGLIYELQDCGFPAVAGISFTDNFIESCKTADVIISLPRQSYNQHRHDNKEVNMSYASLTQMDFECLNNAMFPTVHSKNNVCSMKSHGPMSTANTISRYLRQFYEQSLQDIQREKDNRREEAQFGCPPDPSIIDISMSHDDSFHKSRDLQVRKRTVFMSVSATKVDDDTLVEKDSVDIFSKIFARL